jgi:hypothetical protein
MHRNLKGKRGGVIDYIHINGVFGYLSSLLNTEILHAGMEKDTEIKTIVAVNKLLWVQNDFFSKYYVNSTPGETISSGLAGAVETLLSGSIHARRKSAPPAPTVSLLQQVQQVLQAPSAKSTPPSTPRPSSVVSTTPASPESHSSGTPPGNLSILTPPPCRRASQDYFPIAEIKLQRSRRVSNGENAELTKLPDLRNSRSIDRPALFIKKIQQCCVIFDYTDKFSDMIGKDIKSNALSEITEYVSARNGFLNEDVYPVVVHMVIRFKLTALLDFCQLI